jgi:hypothetical protein
MKRHREQGECENRPCERKGSSPTDHGAPRGPPVVSESAAATSQATSSSSGEPDDAFQRTSSSATSSSETPQGRGAEELPQSPNNTERTAKSAKRKITVHHQQIKQPGQFDILCGRGRPFQEHPGNLLLRQVVDLHRERYKTAERNHRGAIADEVVVALKASRNRFLKQDDETEGWEEIDDEDAKEKVSHCFRSRLRVPSKDTSNSQYRGRGNGLVPFTQEQLLQRATATTNHSMVVVQQQNGYQLPAMMHRAASSTTTSQNEDTESYMDLLRDALTED